jgi:hypothetical protein
MRVRLPDTRPYFLDVDVVLPTRSLALSLTLSALSLALLVAARALAVAMAIVGRAQARDAATALSFCPNQVRHHLLQLVTHLQRFFPGPNYHRRPLPPWLPVLEARAPRATTRRAAPLYACVLV